MKQQSFVVAVFFALVASFWSAGPAFSQTTPDPHADPQLDSSIHCEIPRGEGVIMALDINVDVVEVLEAESYVTGESLPLQSWVLLVR